MKNTFREIGDWSIKIPEKVLKLGLVMDDHKLSRKEQIWEECERRAPEKAPLFRKEDFFYEENIQSGNLIYSFRYYTPEDNRAKKVIGGANG